jgi:hypothetical protein
VARNSPFVDQTKIMRSRKFLDHLHADFPGGSSDRYAHDATVIRCDMLIGFTDKTSVRRCLRCSWLDQYEWIPGSPSGDWIMTSKGSARKARETSSILFSMRTGSRSAQEN